MHVRTSLPDTILLIFSRSSISLFCARAFLSMISSPLDVLRTHCSLQNQLRPSENCIQWRPELMREGCEELILDAAGALGLYPSDSLALKQLLFFFVRALEPIDMGIQSPAIEELLAKVRRA